MDDRDEKHRETQAEVSLKEEELRKSIEEQREIVLCDPVHRWYAGERFGHDPEPNELWIHWAESGAAEAYRKGFSARKSG